MTTSGTTTFTVNRDEIIYSALRLCGVLAESQAANSEHVSTSAFALNMILKNLAIEGWQTWVYEWITWTTVVDQASYTIGPTGANVTANRPLRIANAFIRDTQNNNFDTPIIPLTRQEYDMLSPKDQHGIPNSFYYDTTLDKGTFYIWPVTQDTTHQIRINTQRQIQDITSSTQNFDLPQEYFLPLQWMLASEIGPSYGVTERQQQRIDQRAEYYRDRITSYEVAEEPSVYFQPSSQLGR